MFRILSIVIGATLIVLAVTGQSGPMIGHIRTWLASDDSEPGQTTGADRRRLVDQLSRLRDEIVGEQAKLAALRNTPPAPQPPAAAPAPGPAPVPVPTPVVPPASPPPATVSPPPEADAVLHRLRRQATESRPPVDDAAPVEPPVRPITPPAVPPPSRSVMARLAAARAALGAGDVEACRRSLQQAQMELVFGQSGPAAMATDVGRALAALGNDDRAGAQRLIDGVIGRRQEAAGAP